MAKVVWFDDTEDKSNPMNERCDKKNPDKFRHQKINWPGGNARINLQ